MQRGHHVIGGGACVPPACFSAAAAAASHSCGPPGSAAAQAAPEVAAAAGAEICAFPGSPAPSASRQPVLSRWSSLSRSSRRLPLAVRGRRPGAEPLQVSERRDGVLAPSHRPPPRVGLRGGVMSGLGGDVGAPAWHGVALLESGTRRGSTGRAAPARALAVT